MQYTLKQTGSTYAIQHKNKTYNAGNDITKAMLVISMLNDGSWFRVQERPDGLYACEDEEDTVIDYLKVINYQSYPTILDQRDFIPETTIAYITPAQVVDKYDMIPEKYWTIATPSTPHSLITVIPPQPVTGWICPKCGAGVSPYSPKCPCSNTYNVTC